MCYKTIKATCIITLFALGLTNAMAQNRMVFNNNAYVVITNSAYLVVDNSNSNAITLAGTGGNIISENEFNRVKWNIGTSVGTYVVPFTKSAGNKIQLRLGITTAGVGGGYILFSTYGSATWDNNTYKPSDVTGMGAICCGANNSANVIDRFWIIDALNYTTKPTVRITFTYLDAEWSGAGNTITESSLFAQRFNSTINDWGDWLGLFGTTGIATNNTSTGNVTPANFFRSWTLVNELTPLPIGLLYFNVICNNDGKRHFNWATGSESDNKNFTIQASNDAATWVDIAQVAGAGNSTAKQNYFYTQAAPYLFNGGSEGNYYRLKQTDFSEQFSYSDIEYNICDDASIPDFTLFPNPSTGNLNLLVNNVTDNSILVSIHNTLGQLVWEKEIAVTDNTYSEQITLDKLQKGIYYLTTKTSTGTNTQKLILQ